MEDMARLAVFEQYVKDTDKFYEILQELLVFINHILDNPHEIGSRTTSTDLLKKYLTCEVFIDYLRYIGFQTLQNELTYPKEQSVSRLRMAQAAIERKLSFCSASIKTVRSTGERAMRQNKKEQIQPCYVKLPRLDSFLVRIRTFFNHMLRYENEDLLRSAKEQVPLVTLQTMALERMREQQKKIKTGEIKGPDMSFDLALLMELMGWFKHKFFKWVDSPDCEMCGGATKFTVTESMLSGNETCLREIYKCTKCSKGASFIRYNEPATLLSTRRGRCGEWANCFALFCRALGYEARYVYDTTDHVWCEVFDYDSNRWMHVDPCEGAIDTPLMYCHGWGKTISYVFAFSKDDLQDVTWRYTINHKEVLARRNKVTEKELLDTILSLRAHRHSQLSPARRNYLTVRGLKEIVDLMFERKPTDYESHGRISGSRQWREDRGEVGQSLPSHTFVFSSIGDHAVRYHTAFDTYRIYHNGAESDPVDKWSSGVYQYQNVFRKVENDWRQTYLAREEGADTGSISWRYAATGDDVIFTSISIKLTTAVYENGSIDWTINFDDEPQPEKLVGKENVFSRNFSSLILKAQLSGGRGDVAWQHAQLFRQSKDDETPTFEVVLNLGRK